MKYFLSLLAALMVYNSQAAVVYVDVDSNALIPGGSSWNQAFRSMTDAFNAANPGDQIWVAEGTYYEYSVRCGKGVEIYCGFQGWETSLAQRDWENNECIFSQLVSPYFYSTVLGVQSNYGSDVTGLLDGAYFSNWGYLQGKENFIYMSHYMENVQINNCTFTNILATDYFIDQNENSDDLTVEFNNCHFSNVITNEKAYIEFVNGQFMYKDCSFTICQFGLGTDDWNFRNTDFVNTSFYSCQMSTLASNSSSLNSCLIEACDFTSQVNSALNTADIVNCTFVNNDCDKRLFANVNLYNTILYGNTSAQGISHVSNSQATAFNCILQQEFTGVGGNNSQDDPLFEDPGNRNFCLSECSPAIDNTQIGISLYPLDLKGNPRVVNNELDLGCYEFQGASKKVIYVNHAATGANDGSSWSNAFTKLQNALNAICENSEIWMAKGNYYPNQTPATVNRFATFAVPDGAKIYGGFAGNETSIDSRPSEIFGTGTRTALLGTNGTGTTADDAYHIATISVGGSNVIFDGLYFAYGRANGGGDLGAGGAIWMKNGSATINNCRFEANYGLSGGAVHIAGNATVNFTNSQLSFNTAQSDGGAIKCVQVGSAAPEVVIDRTWVLYNSAHRGGGLHLGLGNYQISNSLINSNSASQNGSAIYNTGTLTINNCTVHGHDEAFYLSGTNTFYNSIFWDNSADFEDAPSIVSKTIQYCNLSSPIAGIGNTNLNPFFVDADNWSFDLSIGSPMINSGSNTYAVGELDYAGVTRISGGTVDKGAFEYNVACSSPNDLCNDASDIDVFTANTVFADMTCATETGDINVSSCGVAGARSVWYRFVMPNHRIQFYLGDSPEDTFEDRVMSVFKGSCANPVGSYCGQYLIITPEYIAPGEQVYIKLTEWLQPDVISFNIVPIIPEITSVSPGQQSDCQSGAPFSTYLQQIFVQYDNTETYTHIEVNGILYALTGSPQLINMAEVIADGNFWDLELKIYESAAEMIIPDFAQAPCCAPLNDYCSHAFPLTFGEPQIGQTHCASIEVDDVLSSCTIGLGNSLWYEFEAPASGTVSLQGDIIELGTPTNLRISVWDLNDGCADPVEVGCINNNGNNYGEYGEVSGLNPGQIYAVRVSGYQQQKVKFAITVYEIESTCGCLGDFNADCGVNSADLLILLSEFGCTSNCETDLNNDAEVNSADLLSFLALFGTNCLP